MLQGEFRDTESLIAVYQFVNDRGAASLNYQPFSLMQQHPRVEFTSVQTQLSLRELGLNQTTLVAVPVVSSAASSAAVAQ